MIIMVYLGLIGNDDRVYHNFIRIYLDNIDKEYAHAKKKMLIFFMLY